MKSYYTNHGQGNRCKKSTEIKTAEAFNDVRTAQVVIYLDFVDINLVYFLISKQQFLKIALNTRIASKQNIAPT